MKTAQTNNGVHEQSYQVLIFIIVTIKLTAPRIEDTPATCKLKIAKSTEPPECACIPAKGGYTVHPVPTPASTSDEDNNKINAGGNNQNELFNLGNAMSQAPIIIGINQLPAHCCGHYKEKIIKNALKQLKRYKADS